LTPTGKRVLLIVPDSTRTAPVGQLFRVIHDQVGAATRSLDVMIALGTQPPMTEEAILRRLEIKMLGQIDVASWHGSLLLRRIAST
jgi:lactate racemase